MDRGVKILHRAAQEANSVESDAAVFVPNRILRIEPERGVVASHGLIVVFLIVIGVAAIVERLKIFRVKCPSGIIPSPYLAVAA